MKKFLFLLFIAATLSLFTTSCEKENNITEDLELIEQIATSEDKQLVEPDDLSASIRTTIDDNYFETYIETAYLAENVGYEVTLGSGENIYFNVDGDQLQSRRGKRHGHGPCGKGHRGTPVDIADLPTSISDYVAANYTNGEIKKAKTNDDGEFFVLVKSDDGKMVLKFDADGNFIEEVSCVVHHGCGGITPVDIADLPTTITDYIAANYPDADIKKAGQKIQNGNYAVVLNINGDRVIVVFDEDGNFLFERS